MTVTDLLVLTVVFLGPALILRRHLLAYRATPAEPGPVREPAMRDLSLVRRIPADIAGAYALEPPDKDMARELLLRAATPAAHRYAVAMTLRAATRSHRQ